MHKRNGLKPRISLGTSTIFNQDEKSMIGVSVYSVCSMPELCA